MGDEVKPKVKSMLLFIFVNNVMLSGSFNIQNSTHGFLNLSRSSACFSFGRIWLSPFLYVNGFRPSSLRSGSILFSPFLFWGRICFSLFVFDAVWRSPVLYCGGIQTSLIPVVVDIRSSIMHGGGITLGLVPLMTDFDYRLEMFITVSGGRHYHLVTDLRHVA